jgi:hypothetical protein
MNDGFHFIAVAVKNSIFKYYAVTFTLGLVNVINNVFAYFMRRAYCHN